MDVQVIRSKRRRKTVSTREEKGVIKLSIPTSFSSKEEEKYVKWAKNHIERKKRKKDLQKTNADKLIEQKAQRFNKKYFEGKLSWNNIMYSTRQNKSLFGVCDLKTKNIRLSHRLLDMPRFVHDYVLVHELAHLKYRSHGPRFWQLVNQYPKTERARGYLMAIGMEDT